jgi:hypothetical protein
MFLDQAEQIGRMHGMMRHADEIGLGEVVEFGGVEESEEIGHKKSGYRRVIEKRGQAAPSTRLARLRS